MPEYFYDSTKISERLVWHWNLVKSSPEERPSHLKKEMQDILFSTEKMVSP